MQNYDVVFLGYPIWFGDAPRIVSTFVESYNFKGKMVVPFCTSGSSGIGKSASRLAKLGEGTWLSERRFSRNSSSKTIEEWVQGLGVLEETGGQGKDSVMNIQVGKKVFKAKLADNSSGKALAKKLAKGPLQSQCRIMAVLKRSEILDLTWLQTISRSQRNRETWFYTRETNL